jgi:hypothetical protein
MRLVIKQWQTLLAEFDFGDIECELVVGFSDLENSFSYIVDGFARFQHRR